MRIAFVVVLGCTVVMASGCSNKQVKAVEDESAGGALQWSTSPTEQRRDSLDPAVVRSVRPEQQERFDRIVFEFSTSAVPGYQIAYTDEPARECGSGKPVTVRGTSTLFVRLSPAQAHTDEGQGTLQWQQRQFAFPTLQEVRQSCDFEAEVSWVLGLAARNGFHVSELTDPARLIIDIQH
jgi:hypothetical protein